MPVYEVLLEKFLSVVAKQYFIVQAFDYQSILVDIRLSLSTSLLACWADVP